MKKVFIIILTLIAVQSFGQSSTPPGYTRFYSKSAGDYWNINAGNIVTKDTNTAPVAIGEVRLKTSDSTVYIALSTTAAKKWYAIKGATPSGAGTGSVTSVGIVASGALGSTGGPITSSGNITLGWQGTSSDVVFADGSYSNLNGAIGTYSDARYSPLGHTHTFSQITDGASAVGALFSAGTGLSYNPTTRTYSATGPVSQDGLQSGGVVTWSGTGLVFDITAASYVLGGSPYTSPVSQVTLDPADGSYGRWDAIIVTNSGTVSKITGTAAASPVLPQSDPASQIILTYVFVDAGATTPTQVSNEVIYDENIEWTHTTSGSVTANFASTAFAEQGSKSISTTWTSPSNLIFTNGSVLSAGNYTTISFYVRLSGPLANNTNISAQFYNSTNAVSNSVTASISKTTTGSWQLVSFNISQFSFTSTSFNAVRLILTGSTVGTLGTTTVYFDNIRLQAGITPPTTVQGLQSAYTKVYDGTTIAAATGSDQLRFRTDNTMSVAVANNDATYGDYVLYKVDTTKIATKYFVTSSIPTLQSVTNSGKTTTNDVTITHYLTVNGDNNAAAAKLNTDNFGGTDAGGSLELKTLFSTYYAVVSPINSYSSTHYFKLAQNGNGSGTDTLATLADVRSGGSTPDLQAVTNAGYSITNPIISTSAIVSESQFQARADAGVRVVNASTFSSRVQMGMTSDNGYLAITNTSGSTGTVKADNLSGNYTYQMPNQAGTILIGATPTSSTDNTVTHKIKVNIGGTDYYIMATTSSL